MKTCPNCKTEIPKKAKYCTECGYEFILLKCVECGTMHESPAKYCMKCKSPNLKKYEPITYEELLDIFIEINKFET